MNHINNVLLFPPYKTIEYMKWWFFNKLIPVSVYCAVVDNSIIGTTAVFKRQLTNGLTCGVLMGLVVNRSWWGKGIIKKLFDKVHQRSLPLI